MKPAHHSCEVLVIGGGPAGASAARLLAARGHSVTLASRPIDDRRGIAESLPPSTRRVLAAVGVLDAVEASGTCRNVGNTVWWGSGDRRVENFGGHEDASGWQVWRPHFDRLLIEQAVSAGVTCRTGNVQHVSSTSDGFETRVGRPDGSTEHVRSAFVVDASGRSAVLARHQRRAIAGQRMHAWVGRWQHSCGVDIGTDTRTLVETTDDGWVWSVPISTTERCVTVMIDPDRTRFACGGRLEHRYRGELAKAVNIRQLLRDASLQEVWGCDASLYDTVELSGSHHLIVGDAASFIDPLSSFGVKKALTSAWMAAAVVHTCLTEPAISVAARNLFAAREREAYVSSVRASADYARVAAAHHDSPFWNGRTELPPALAGEIDDEDLARGPEVARAFDDLRGRPEIGLQKASSVRLEWQPAFRGDRVELELAVSAATLQRPVRFIENVDLTRLVEIAGQYRQIGELFDGYCRRAAPVPLPNFLKALSVLVARRVLEPVAC